MDRVTRIVCTLAALSLPPLVLAQASPEPATQDRSNQLIMRPVLSPLERATPEQRAKVRSQLEIENFDLRERVPLDPAEAAQLIELMVDQVISEAGNRGFAGLWGVSSLYQFEQRLQQVRNLLGEQRLATYLDYDKELPLRRRIVEFDTQLEAASKLSLRQKQQLVSVLARQEIEELRDRRKLFAFVPEDPNEAREVVKKFDLERYEFDFRNQRQRLRLELDAVRTLLTPPQRLVFERVANDKLKSLQTYVENMRVAAGLSRTIPD